MKIAATTVARGNLNQWRAGQGARIRAKSEDVFRACDHIAKQWAALRDPLELTADEIKLAVHRAISQQRRKEYGDLPASADTFWEQISSIAQRWNVATKREDWEKSTKTVPKPAEAERMAA